MAPRSSRGVSTLSMNESHRLRTDSHSARYQGKNFIDIFALLIIQRMACENGVKKRAGLFAKRTHPFSFLVTEAIEEMQALSLDIAQDTVVTTISYSIKPDLSLSLLRNFFAAKFVHNPESRTDASLTLESVMQVTPKGAAVVYHVCKKFGLATSNVPKIITSTFNTMDLFIYDRLDSNRLRYSEFVISILVTKMMGDHPNVWSASNKPEQVENIFFKEQSGLFTHLLQKGTDDFAIPKNEPNKTFISPFHHKYFTNPTSDAHVQYYESQSGIRVYCNKIFNDGGEDVTVECCFTGKAIVQWLIDCTALYSVSEACEIGRLILRYGLIVSVTDNNTGAHFFNHRDAYYTLSEEGHRVCKWKDPNGTYNTSQSPMSEASTGTEAISGTEATTATEATTGTEAATEQLSLKTILNDPGMRCLFRQHAERECYAENVEAYEKLVEFAALKRKIAKLWKLHKLCDAERQSVVKEAIDRQTSACFSRALYLYATYLSVDSRFDVNLDFELRQEVHNVMQLKRQDEPQPGLSAYVTTPTYEKLLSWDAQSGFTSSGTDLESGSAGDCDLSGSSETGGDGEPGKDWECLNVTKGNGTNVTKGNDSQELKTGESLSSCGSLTTSEPHGTEVGGGRATSADLTARLDEIYVVFTRVKNSIYKLIEDDSYPRFIRSKEYTYAMDIKTHRS